ncbi:ribonuclease R winged-helix domain-containing protein [Natronococcus jeotgali DSM 18795]|uniref:Ribonuclease R winged-helix domain-containing protein n=1 Tax=Natronococcus jeotgali DSM 18795 TaxID=1227498 RepID=L9XLL3_9EURY|nr:ribonuclease R winged-helix domain-containing protein [Natronococcus jeotgali DSM 18795]
MTYDPFEDTGEVIAASATVPDSDLDAALEALSALAETPIGPLPIALDHEDNEHQLLLPSSLTLDGVLLSRGIKTDLKTAGLAEYRTDPSSTTQENTTSENGAISRYTDAISGERSTMDVVDLLLESRRTSTENLLAGTDPALLVVDNREVPLVRYRETRDLAETTREQLGGVLDLRRPRETGPFPLETPGWDFASLTYGAGEIALALLVEREIAVSFETLAGLMPRSEFELVELTSVR